MKKIYLKDYEPPHFFIETVQLNFQLFDEVTQVTSKLTIHRNPKFPHKVLVLDGEHLRLISIKLNQQSLSQEQYTVTNEHLTIAEVPDEFTLEIVTEIKPHENSALTGLYKTNDLYCTQCEAHGFRRITYFIDRPDVMSRYTTTIEADKAHYPILLSNGNKIAEGQAENNRHWVTWEDPFKKPCYLFALVAGDLGCLTDSFTTCSGREVVLKIFAEKGNETKCHHAMESLKQSMKWDEDEFGREYDLDIFMIVAVPYFNMGAMENKGLNVFNDKYILANPLTATDTDYEGIAVVVAHEYFHNWTGNRITCRDWFQLSLKEGLTVFRDQEFCAFISSAGVTRIDDIRILRSSQFLEDAGPLAHPVRPEAYIEMNNFYTATVYNKGAEVIRMMQTILGKAGFRKGMDLYFARHDGQAVTCDDFVQAMEDANDINLNQFRRWYSQAGTPEVIVQRSFDAKGQKYSLKFQQTIPSTPGQPLKEPMDIPIKTALFNEQGNILPLADQQEATVLRLDEAEKTFVFDNITAAPIPSLLRNFSAPIKLKLDFTNEELAFLWQYDNDPFNQWEAGQRLVTQIILNFLASSPEKMQLPDNFLVALTGLLKNSQLDRALLALMLNLPTEIYLGSLVKPVPVEQLHEIRKFIRTEIGKHCKNLFLDLYQNSQQQGSYQFTPAAVGLRSLKNTCLNYLCQTNDPKMWQLAYEQFAKADNMTDELGALMAVNNVECPEREQLLSEFYQKWQQEPLVLDKWLTVQAQSELPDTLARVKELILHEAFNLRNPNRVRALIGAFCAGNQRWFHDSARMSCCRFASKRRQ